MTTPRAKVLVVEDDVHLLELFAHALRRMGFQVVTALDAVEAARITGPFDAMIVDVGLPRGKPEDLEQRWPETPMLVISGAEHPKRQFKHFMLKPFDSREIVKYLRELIETPS